MVDAFLQDVRYALRHLRRSPGFAAGAMLTLGLGIGVNTAVFSVLNALVLRPLAIKDPGGLIGVSTINSLGQLRSTLVPVVDLVKDGPLEGACAYSSTIVGTEINGAPADAAVDLVSDGCLPTLGVQPLLGRNFTPDEAPTRRAGARVVVIGYGFWQKMFGGATDVIGRAFRTDGDAVTVIGVMPRGFTGMRVDNAVDIIAPFGTVVPYPPNRPAAATHILGRLRAGVTLDAAQSELAARWRPMLDRVIPSTLSAAEQSNFRDVTIRVEPLGTGFSLLRSRYARPLRIAAALAAALLLLACINVGGLVLAHVAARGDELAICSALGAGRLRMGRQLVFETLAVAAGATALGTGIAWAAVAPIASLLPFGGLAPTVSMTPDLRVMMVTASAGLIAGLLASVLPISLASRRARLSLQSTRTVVTAHTRQGRMLLVVQVALSVVLLMGAGLLARSLYLLFHNNPGFSATGILSARLRPLPGAYRDRAFNNGLAYYPVLLERIAALPGVRSVGYARAFGNADRDDVGRMNIGYVGAQSGGVTAQLDVVSPGFFETIGIPIVFGRGPRWSDTPQTPRVAFVSASLAHALGGAVIGKHVWFGTDPAFRHVEIVGIVGNASLGNLRSPAPPVFYVPAVQFGPWGLYPTLEIATSGDPWLVVEPLRETLRSLGREHAFNITTLDERLRRNATNERLSATLAMTVAALAAVLAFVGIYSLFAYTVARRTREIGLRVAVGASPSSVQLMVLRDSILLTVAGIAIGVPAGMGVGRSLRTVMFGITEHDPITVVAVGSLFVLLAVAATLFPARRAASVDPMIALRSE